MQQAKKQVLDQKPEERYSSQLVCLTAVPVNREDDCSQQIRPQDPHHVDELDISQLCSLLNYPGNAWWGLLIPYSLDPCLSKVGS
jgi:hypothetical protein